MIKVEKYNVRIVNRGDRYGINDCLVSDRDQMVEFYDARYDPPCYMGRGTFVRSYRADMIVRGDYPGGLCLDDGYKAEWSVSAAGMKMVVDYINSQRKAK